MEKYIKGNKEAWEEAFENRDSSFGRDICKRIMSEEYPFFNKDMQKVLRKISEGKVVGQFCCNNGRELLSFVKSGKAIKGVGFDIAENQIAFANSKAEELKLPCKFEAVNIYDIDDRYNSFFDVVIITIGTLCWFKDLNRFFKIVTNCMKKGAIIIINEQHPCTNMIASTGEELFDQNHPLESKYSYFEHEWIGNEGMFYMTLKSYKSKTFTDFTHSLSEIIAGMCKNKITITDLQEFDYDVSGSFEAIERCGYPLSMIIVGRKE